MRLEFDVAVGARVAQSEGLGGDRIGNRCRHERAVQDDCGRPREVESRRAQIDDAIACFDGEIARAAIPILAVVRVEESSVLRW
jgi:hypothetical protein